LLINAKEKNAMLEKILPLQKQTNVSLEKAFPSLSIDDTENMQLMRYSRKEGKL
jgi:hypothetical protein